MQKRELRLIGVAIIIGALAVGAYFYSNSEETPLATETPVVSPNTPVPTPEVATPATETAPVADQPAQVTEATANVAVEPPAPDPLVTHQEQLLKNFKDKIRLNIALPGDMNFDELDLDADVAAIQGNSPDKKMAILAAATTASPQSVAAFLQEQKGRIPLLGNHDFKISGDLQSVPAPKNSGISKITVIPGGEKNGSVIYAALIERSDKKGSYLMLMEGSPAYFEKYEGDMDNMLSSISVK